MLTTTISINRTYVVYIMISLSHVSTARFDTIG